MAKARFNNNKNKSKKTRFVGEVRQTQLITTYGIGSIVDFVRDTVMIAGVDDWDTGKNADDIESRRIFNENLQALTGAKYFLQPKLSTGSGFIKSADIPAFVFPEWLYCPRCNGLINAKEMANQKNPRKCLFNNKDGKPCNGSLIASRFVVICENGHIEDFPYSWWIHGQQECNRPKLSMYNVGGRSDIESLFVKCVTCGKSRGMNGVFASHALAGENGYPCKGNHPHLKERKAREPDCDAPLKTSVRSSTKVYFPVTMSALLIPPWSQKAVEIIQKEYDALEHMPDPKPYLDKKTTSSVDISQLLKAFEIVKARKGSSLPRNEENIYQDEYKVLTANGKTNDDDYSAFVADIPVGFERYFEQITVVDRLTVTEALVGFTRSKPWSGDTGNGGENQRMLSPLSTYKKDWFPAVQLRGEGIFIQFRQDAINDWKSRISTRYAKMREQLQTSYMKSRCDRFSEEYVMLHTFSHLFIRQLSIECGYSASSLKEKIYSTFADSNGETMNGVLIYTASSDCDGSLGGLISVAQNTEKLQNILIDMLHRAAWCSGDPLCVTSLEQGLNSLNYSACHDCTLLPETSCEFRNVLLDRVSIIGTPDEPELGFMRDLLV